MQGAERDSPAEHMLAIIQLKLLAEQGKRYFTSLCNICVLLILICHSHHLFYSMGVDVALLPQLAAEADPAERRRKVTTIICAFFNCGFIRSLPSSLQTTQHLEKYDKMGRKLFAQTVRVVLEGMETRYKDVSL